MATDDRGDFDFARKKPEPGGGVRRWIFILLEDPASSRLAQCIGSGILLCIVTSIAALILESDPEVRLQHGDTLRNVEVWTTLIFTVEYFTRLVVCNEGHITKFQFVTSPANIIDLCAIFPFYLEEGMKVYDIGMNVKFLKVLRAVRLVRLFRIFKVGRFAAGIRVMGEAIAKSQHALNILVFFVVVFMVLFSSAVYYTEKLICPNFAPSEVGMADFVAYERDCRLGISERLCCVYACNPSNPGVTDLEHFDFARHYGWYDTPPNASADDFANTLCTYEMNEIDMREVRQSNPSLPDVLDEVFVVHPVASMTFRSIPQSFWWAIVSMTTSGYGDKVPVTFGGRTFAVMAMCFGILLIALPVAIVGSKFQEAFAKMERGRAMEREFSVIGSAKVVPLEEFEPRRLVPAAKEAEETPVQDIVAAFFPSLAPLIQEVPPNHAACEIVTRVVQSYTKLSRVQAEILQTQRKFVTSQQRLGEELGVLIGADSCPTVPKTGRAFPTS
jgi:hypothetical protein